MSRAEIIKRREQELIGHMRETLLHLDTDLATAREHRNEVDWIFMGHLLEWSDDFCALYEDIMVIYRSFTPHKKGTYKNSSVEIGYSALPVSRWVDDKIQPARPTSTELVARFDALIDTWNRKKEGNHE